MLPLLDPSNRPVVKTIDPAPVSAVSSAPDESTGDSPLMPDPEPVKQEPVSNGSE
jgi:hypothetical protein